MALGVPQSPDGFSATSTSVGSPRNLFKKWDSTNYKNRQARIAALNQKQSQVSIPALAAGAVQQTQAAQAAQQPVQASQPVATGQRPQAPRGGQRGVNALPQKDREALMTAFQNVFEYSGVDPAQKMYKPTRKQSQMNFDLRQALNAGNKGAEYGLQGLLDTLQGTISLEKGNKVISGLNPAAFKPNSVGGIQSPIYQELLDQGYKIVRSGTSTGAIGANEATRQLAQFKGAQPKNPGFKKQRQAENVAAAKKLVKKLRKQGKKAVRNGTTVYVG